MSSLIKPEDDQAGADPSAEENKIKYLKSLIYH